MIRTGVICSEVCSGVICSGVTSATNTASDAVISVTKPVEIHSEINARDPQTIVSTALNTVQVQLDPLTGCGACSASGGCGVQLLPVARVPFLVDCQMPQGAAVSVGDRVQVQLVEPDSHWLGIVIYAYGSPTIGMIFGAVAGFWCAHALHVPQFTESFSLAGFVAGLTGGLIAWCRAEKSVQMRYTDETRAKICKVIPAV